MAKCSDNGSRERRMIITKPVIKMVGEEGDKKPVIQRVDEKFNEEDLVMDCLVPKEETEEDEVEETVEVDTDDSSDENSEEEDWLSAL